MEGLKPFALWALIAILVGGLIYLAQWQGWIPGTPPFWALGVVLVLALGFANLLARGPRQG
jgi:CHASE2 domain-containing sensor protein